MKFPNELMEFFRREGKKGGKLGGPARAASMSKKERSESARHAVKARWDKCRQEAEETVKQSARFKDFWRNPANLNPKLSAADLHYSPQQLAELWGVSAETIRTIFRHEPGVRFGKARVTMTIPSSVAERVQDRLS